MASSGADGGDERALITGCVGGPREPGAHRGTMGLKRVWPVLGRDGGEHEDADERLGQAEQAAVRGVLDQRAHSL